MNEWDIILLGKDIPDVVFNGNYVPKRFEGRGCSFKLKQIAITQSIKKKVIGFNDIKELVTHNGIMNENGEILFYTTDPQVVLPFSGDIENLTIEGELSIMSFDQIIQYKDQVIASMNRSYAMKIGKMITWLPKKVLNILFYLRVKVMIQNILRLTKLVKLLFLKYRYLKYFNKKIGLEIGGPSPILKKGELLPVYSVAENIDGVNFSGNTLWEGKILQGDNYNYEEAKTGYQYIGEAIKLSTFVSGKYDFVVLCHSLEHFSNPLKVLEEVTKVLKKTGYILIIVPNKEYTFDHKRMITTIDHLLEDYNANIDEKDLTHLEEILEKHDLSMDIPAGNYEDFQKRSLKNFENRCLHQHVFDLELVSQVFDYFAIKKIYMFTDGMHHVALGNLNQAT